MQHVLSIRVLLLTSTQPDGRSAPHGLNLKEKNTAIVLVAKKNHVQTLFRSHTLNTRKGGAAHLTLRA